MTNPNLENVLKRQKELFNSYIKTRSSEATLLSYLENYSKEDGKLYSFQLILDYLNLYLASDLITEIDLEKYNKKKTLSVKSIEDRGRELITKLIATRGKWENVEKIGIDYSQIDGMEQPYSIQTLRKYVNYFISRNIDPKLIKEYKIAFEFGKNSSTANYDLNFIHSLLNNSMDDACLVLKSRKVTLQQMRALRNIYANLFPENKDKTLFLDNLIDKTYLTIEMPKLKDSKEVDTSKKETLRPLNKKRVEDIKNLFREYMKRDVKDIEDLYSDLGLTKSHVFNALKNADIINDRELFDLIRQYKTKKQIVFAIRKSILELIMFYKNNGINYGNGLREFNLFDLYNMLDESVKKLLFASKIIYSGSAGKDIKNYLLNLTTSRIYDTKEELLDKVSYTFNGRTINESEKEMIVSYMDFNGWPYSDKLFMDMSRRYIEGDLILKTEEVTPTMNKM